MKPENEHNDFGGTLLIIVLFLLFACSFSNSSLHKESVKFRVESNLVHHPDHNALPTVNTIIDQAGSMTSVPVKNSVRLHDEYKIMYDSRMASKRMANLQKARDLTVPAIIRRFYPMYHYHTPVTDEYNVQV
jgi:hypothetical protein